MRCYANETLTCVDRYADRYLTLGGTAFQFAMYRDGLSNTLYVTVNWVQESPYNGALEDMLQCRVNTKYYNFARIDGWEDPVCTLPYITEPSVEDETVLIPARYALMPKNNWNTMYFNFTEYGEYLMYPGVYSVLPQLALPEVTLYGNHSQRIRWTLTPGDDRQGWVSSMELRYRDPGSDGYISEAVFTNSLHSYYQLQTGADIIGKEVCLMLEYRTFAADWNGYNLESFATLNRTMTPWQMVERDASIPLPPEWITTSMLLAGGKVTVQWPAVTDPLNPISAYRLERAVGETDGTPKTFVQLYKGTSAQFRDTLPNNAVKVIYRVCAGNRYGSESPWTETGTLDVAQSNVYVSRGGTWVRAAGVWIGEKRASPMAVVKR